MCKLPGKAKGVPALGRDKRVGVEVESVVFSGDGGGDCVGF